MDSSRLELGGQMMSLGPPHLCLVIGDSLQMSVCRLFSFGEFNGKAVERRGELFMPLAANGGHSPYFIEKGLLKILTELGAAICSQ